MKVKEIIKRGYDTDLKKNIICILLIIITCIVVMIPTLHITQRDIGVPYQFNGGDLMGELAGFSYIEETGTWTKSNRTGAPFGVDANLQSTYTSNFDNLIKVLLIRIFNNKFIAFNIFYLGLFFEIAIVAFLSMRSMRISHLMSYLGAVIYAFLPAIFLRGQGHLVVSCYQFVPLGILLSYWIYTDEKFLRPDKLFWKYNRNVIALVLIVLIGSNGMGYYPVFSCFFIIIAGVSCFIKNKKFEELVKSVIVCASTALVFFLNCMPYLLSIFSDDFSGSLSRNAEGAETYGLKVIQLLLPINGHGIEPLQKIITHYNENAPLVNENRWAYLGLIGVVGFLILLVILFTKKSDKRLVLFIDLNICAVLLATIGGFGSILCNTFFRLLRSYNRISVCIAFFTIASVCILCDKLLMLEKIKNIKFRKDILIIIIVCCFSFALWEQCDGVGGTAKSIESIRHTEQLVNELENYFGAVETQMGEGAMIYCLPYYHYPEGRLVHNMGNAELYTPYLFTDTLKWSFGLIYGTYEDLWDQRISQLPTERMLEQLSIFGFDGVFVNANAYDADALNMLLNELEENLHTEPIWDNGVNYVFSMKEYNEFINLNLTEEEKLKYRDELLVSLSYRLGNGFSGTEMNQDGVTWNWCDKMGVMELYSLADCETSVNLEFVPGIKLSQQYNLYVECNGNTYKYPISNNSSRIVLPVKVAKGKTTVKFSTDAPQVDAPSDSRTLYFRLFDIKVLPQNFVSVYDPIFSYSFKDGFYNQEESNGNKWIWCNSEGTLQIDCMKDCELVLNFIPLTNLEDEHELYIQYKDEVYRYSVSRSSEPVELELNLSKGTSELKFSTDAPQVDAPQDSRTMYFRLWNFCATISHEETLGSGD